MSGQANHEDGAASSEPAAPQNTEIMPFSMLTGGSAQPWLLRQDIVGTGSEQAAHFLMIDILKRAAQVQTPQINADGSISYALIAPPVAGIQLSGLLFMAAPSKRHSNNFDTADTIRDWTNLFESSDPIQKDRQERHSHIPGWDKYVQARSRMLASIRNGKPQDDPLSDPLFPVLAWDVKPDGTVCWNDQHTAELVALVDPHETSRYMQELGKLQAGAFSPEVTSTWPKSDSYPACPSGSNDQGATQVLPTLLHRADEVLDAYFMRRIEFSLAAHFKLPAYRGEPVVPSYYPTPIKRRRLKGAGSLLSGEMYI